MKTRNSNNRRNAADDFDFEGDAGVSAETRTAVRDELLKQHSDITAVCKLAGKPELAADFLQEDLSLAEVVAELDELRAEAAKGNGKGKTNANANASGNRRETARDNRNARNARDSRNANGGDVEISARSAVNTSGGDSVVPEINPTKIWDKWNAAGTKAA